MRNNRNRVLKDLVTRGQTSVREPEDYLRDPAPRFKRWLEAEGQLVAFGRALREEEYFGDKDLPKTAVLVAETPRSDTPGAWVHVINADDVTQAGTIDRIAAIDGEVCGSHIDDPLYRTKKTLVAALFAGPANAVHETDVWSEACPVRKLRVSSEETQGAPRTEAWFQPSRCQLIAVLTDCEELAAVLRSQGHTVVMYHYEEDLRWARATWPVDDDYIGDIYVSEDHWKQWERLETAK